MAKEGFTVGGYTFATNQEAQAAIEEMDAIRYLTAKTDQKDIAQVYLLYNKIIEKELFKTPVGLDYLKKLQKYLYSNPNVPNDRIQPIPVRTDAQEVLDTKRASVSYKERNKALSREVSKFKTYFTRSLIINLTLLIIIIAMMVITATSSNPNILNYESALQDRYASWEENLKAREAVIKQREQELGIR